MSLKQRLLATWQWLSRSGVSSVALPELDPAIVLSVPRFAAEVVDGIAVEKHDERTVVVCERPLLPHQIESFESLAGINATTIEFVSDPTKYAHIRPFITLLREHYYKERELESCGCISNYSMKPNLTPRPPLSDSCPRLDLNITAEMFPGHILEWRMIPVERVHGRLVIVCGRPASQQRELVELVYNRTDFELVDDPGEYPEVRAHFDELLRYHSWQPYFEDGFIGCE